MKTIGLIGGMSWASTLPYYRLINERVQQRLGGLHSARLVLVSVDFAEVAQLQHSGDWDGAGAILADAARALQRAGADFVVLATNTMHRVAGAIEAATPLPLLHIADPTAAAARAAGHTTLGLLGTRFTMEQPFYAERLAAQGLRVIVPPEADRARVHGIIYDELCHDVVTEASRAAFQRVMADLQARGAQAVVLGCTEIGLLVRDGDACVPLLDTTRLHALAAADAAVDGAPPQAGM